MMTFEVENSGKVAKKKGTTEALLIGKEHGFRQHSRGASVDLQHVRHQVEPGALAPRNRGFGAKKEPARLPYSPK